MPRKLAILNSFWDKVEKYKSLENLLKQLVFIDIFHKIRLVIGFKTLKKEFEKLLCNIQTCKIYNLYLYINIILYIYIIYCLYKDIFKYKYVMLNI